MHEIHMYVCIYVALRNYRVHLFHSLLYRQIMKTIQNGHAWVKQKWCSPLARIQNEHDQVTANFQTNGSEFKCFCRD